MNPYTQLAELVQPDMDERIDDIVGRLDPEQRRVADTLHASCPCGWSMDGPTADVVAAQIKHRRSHGWTKKQGSKRVLRLTREHAAIGRQRGLEAARNKQP